MTERPTDLNATDMTESSTEKTMIGLISRHQTILHEYIFALLPHSPSEVDDVLQETNLVLWRKAEEYDVSRPFLPWARSIAWFQVKAALRDASRDRLVFSEATMQLLAQEADKLKHPEPTRKERALGQCIAKLSAKQQQLIYNRYQQNRSVAELSTLLKRPVGSISQTLYVVRRNLEKCIELLTTTPNPS